MLEGAWDNGKSTLRESTASWGYSLTRAAVAVHYGQWLKENDNLLDNALDNTGYI